MSVEPKAILALLNHRVTRILTIAEAALPQDRFKAFRKLVLDEMGRNGMETDLYQLFEKQSGSRNG
ncbi:MAG: hypothetical protein RIM33_17170 [Alphaproteobacteria bacterium]